ncbi:MAG: hypothetical protein QG672_1477, partial [Pseudomonadota bacterium]|nr:hypothetical protein [Pseudomonadota bacterium]
MALASLDEHGADALAVVDPESAAPLGILTLRDVLKRIALGGVELELPVATVMTGGVIRLPAEATVHQASVLMIRRDVRHLVLVDDDGRFCNIVSQADLYSRPGARSNELVAAIAEAGTISELAVVAGDVRQFSAHLLAEGFCAEAICQLISALNDLIG